MKTVTKYRTFKEGGTAVFAYSHLKNPKNISDILGRTPKLTEHHLDGFKLTKDSKGEKVIIPDNTSTVRGKKFYVNQKELEKISSEMKPYKKKQIGGDSTYKELYTFFGKGGRLDKDSMKCNSPKRTPNHKTKSHVVKACKNGKEKLIRFGQQGVKGAGDNPKTKKQKARKKAYYARHNAQDSNPDKFSARYWSHKVKWSTGGLFDSFKEGGIHIKKENRGKFTEWCKNKGYNSVTKGCIQEGKSYCKDSKNDKKVNSTICKRATFAQNFAK